MAFDTNWYDDLTLTVAAWFQHASAIFEIALSLVLWAGVGFLLLWGLIAIIHWMWKHS